MKRIAIIVLSLVALPLNIEARNNNLSRAYVSSVASARAGVESITGALNTARDHGGTWMHITTDDIGYGKHPQARLLGSPLREIRTQPLCQIKGRTSLCNGRGTVIGYRRTWDASGREGGNFEYVVIPNELGPPIRIGFQIR